MQSCLSHLLNNGLGGSIRAVRRAMRDTLLQHSRFPSGRPIHLRLVQLRLVQLSQCEIKLKWHLRYVSDLTNPPALKLNSL